MATTRGLSHTQRIGEVNMQKMYEVLFIDPDTFDYTENDGGVFPTEADAIEYADEVADATGQGYDIAPIWMHTDTELRHGG